jgi:hypothetical protein
MPEPQSIQQFHLSMSEQSLQPKGGPLSLSMCMVGINDIKVRTCSDKKTIIYIYIVFVAVGFGFIPPLPTNCRSIVWQQKTREPEGKQ